MYDVLQSQDANTTDSLVADKDSLKTELDRLLASLLSDREQEVLRRFFGIGCDYSLSLDDIAEDLGLTRERARQIKEGALKKLRANFGAMKLLQPYLL
jgi:RNA polymerase primary sigma factor